MVSGQTLWLEWAQKRNALAVKYLQLGPPTATKSLIPAEPTQEDAYSRYACIYGIKDKSLAYVIDTLTRYQADHGHVGHYGYLDIACIHADSGTQFTSENFREHCWKAGISLSLAAPKKQYQYHLAERSWQTISTMARSLLVHVLLPDSFMFHSLVWLIHAWPCRHPLRTLSGR
jgi:transposase InsO family protein